MLDKKHGYSTGVFYYRCGSLATSKQQWASERTFPREVNKALDMSATKTSRVKFVPCSRNGRVHLSRPFAESPKLFESLLNLCRTSLKEHVGGPSNPFGRHVESVLARRWLFFQKGHVDKGCPTHETRKGLQGPGRNRCLSYVRIHC